MGEELKISDDSDKQDSSEKPASQENIDEKSEKSDQQKTVDISNQSIALAGELITNLSSCSKILILSNTVIVKALTVENRFWDNGWHMRSTQWAHFLLGLDAPDPSEQVKT